MYCVVAQLLGSVLGVMVARLVWGPVVAESSVAYAVLQPVPGWSWVRLFLGETVNMSHPRSFCEYLKVPAGGLCEPNDYVTPICVYHVSGAVSSLR